MITSWAQIQQVMMRACFQYELPAVEFIRIDYMPFLDRFNMMLFMHPGKWYFECLLSKDDLNSPDIHGILKPIIKELSDYLNPVWC